MSRRLIFVVQALISAGLLVMVFRNPSVQGQFFSALHSAKPSWLVAGLLVSAIVAALSVIRWGIFLRMLGIRLSNADLWRISFIGLFFNTFLPGGVGGDIVRVIWLAGKGFSKSTVLLSILMDRMSGVFGLAVCSAVFVLPQLDALKQSRELSMAINFGLIYICAMMLMFAVTFVFAIVKLAPKLPASFPMRDKLELIEKVYFEFLRSWRSTLVAVGLATLIHIGYFSTFYFSARAFHEAVPVALFYGIMPSIDIITMLPVSLSGLGLREQLFVSLLGQLCAVPPDKAVAISLAGFALSSVWYLAGAFLIPSYRRVVNEPVPAS